MKIADTSRCDLTVMAKAAKERLSKGYWTKIKQERSDALSRLKENGYDTQIVMSYYAEKCTRDIAAMTNTVDKQEEEMYKKVKQSLDNGVDIANPVSVLMDKRYMSTLSDCEKQRYIFSLMGKYGELKERYVKEIEILKRISCAG